MIKVYVAGAITPTGKENHALEFLENIRKGISTAATLLALGYSPFCPMLDFQYLLCNVSPLKITAKMIYKMSIDWLLSCDCILLLPGHENSTGWKKEEEVAKGAGIPIFTSFIDLEERYELE